MKIIVAGTRDLLQHITRASIKQAIVEGVRTLDLATEIVSGRSGDVDLLGEEYARAHGIPIEPFPADWDKHGRAAGPIRNKQMAEYADALVLVWDGRSPGSSSMLSEARQAGLPIVQVVYHRTIKREGLEALSGREEES